MKALRKYSYEPDYAVPPGRTLEDTMVVQGMTQRELADRTGLTVQTLNRIFNGKQPITYETANKLELVTGTPASFWINLEGQYRLQLNKVVEKQALQKNQAWLETIPVKELVSRKVIPASDDSATQLREVLRFFGVSNINAWKTIWEKPAVAARRSACFESSPGPTSAWIQLGHLKARKIKSSPFEKTKFLECLKKVRGLIKQPVAECLPEVTRLCASAGVAFVVVPEFKKAPWSGAAEWLTPEKAMLLLSLRGKSEDRFWFSFFHEAGHILNDSKKKTYIDNKDSYTHDSLEISANKFASDMLIPREFDCCITAAKTREDIVRIANHADVSISIVVGRFQYLTQKWDLFNSLKQPLQLEEATFDDMISS